MMNYLKQALAYALLMGVAALVISFPLWVLGVAVAYTAAMLIANYSYRKIMGCDMPAYTKVFGNNSSQRV